MSQLPSGWTSVGVCRGRLVKPGVFCLAATERNKSRRGRKEATRPDQAPRLRPVNEPEPLLER